MGKWACARGWGAIMRDQLRLTDLLAALSVATDLGMGQPPDKAIRSCLLATGLARALDLPDREVRDVYLTSLLRHLGCTATAAIEARLYGGDELTSRSAAEPADFGDAREMLALTLGTGRGTGLHRPGLLTRAVLGNIQQGREIFQSICEAASLLAGRLGLGQEVRDCLYQQFERWDGKGVPQGLAKEEIALPARIGEVANQALLFHLKGGPEAAMAMVERRAGGWFDPSVVDVFERHGSALLHELDAVDPWEAVLQAEPSPVRYITPGELDQVARVFADMVDLKATCTLGHSAGVAELAEGAARSLGLAEREAEDLRRAALLHDLGRVGVSSGIWDRPGPVTRTERERIRLHPYHTERILACSRVLAPLGRIAGLHHERLDGSGYHHGLSAAGIPVSARILAVADTFQAATQDRPHRPARSPARAADLLAEEAAAGRLDPDCVRAVVEAAGQAPPPVRSHLPAGLTGREADVLRLLARGLTNKEIAGRLVISRRTAEHHVQHIYGKIGNSTRAAAALFAMEHDLLRV
ncbi:HD domain-containing phosphohydrolase [Streptomyces peucetius]|uniref:HD domain-containing protein n=1 Tax=Streptomyces peucetius TaxID=1950 RepID=A0ABY6ICY3_STRPE|nr:HD domain-containing phosphohydrolase [Streptomyces peucetius]UYQ64850.1 HD domain-containing protein [Streptomyces peucetius]